MKKTWDRISGAIAIIMTLLYGLLFFNGIFNFIKSAHIIKILSEAIYYGGIALVIIVTFEMVSGKHWIIKAIFVLIWVAIIVHSFSPTFFGLLEV